MAFRPSRDRDRFSRVPPSPGFGWDVVTAAAATAAASVVALFLLASTVGDGCPHRLRIDPARLGAGVGEWRFGWTLCDRIGVDGRVASLQGHESWAPAFRVRQMRELARVEWRLDDALRAGDDPAATSTSIDPRCAVAEHYRAGFDPGGRQTTDVDWGSSDFARGRFLSSPVLTVAAPAGGFDDEAAEVVELEFAVFMSGARMLSVLGGFLALWAAATVAVVAVRRRRRSRSAPDGCAEGVRRAN